MNMDPNYFSRLVGEDLQPVMIAHGFTSSRGGKSFQKASEDGHVVLVRPKEYGTWSFRFDWAAIPPVLGDYCREHGKGSRPTLDWGLLRVRLVVPEELRSGDQSLWRVDPEGSFEEFAAAVVENFTTSAIPLWDRALVREYLAHEQRTDPERFWLNTSSFDGHGLTLRWAILYIDDGDPAELTAWLDDAEANEPRPPNDRFIPWLRQRLAARIAGEQSVSS